MQEKKEAATKKLQHNLNPFPFSMDYIKTLKPCQNQSNIVKIIVYSNKVLISWSVGEGREKIFFVHITLLVRPDLKKGPVF